MGIEVTACLVSITDEEIPDGKVVVAQCERWRNVTMSCKQFVIGGESYQGVPDTWFRLSELRYMNTP